MARCPSRWPVGRRDEARAVSTAKSVVSRKFVAMPETALAQLLASDLSTLDVVVFTADHVHFAEQC